MLTTADAAKSLRLSEYTIRRFCADKRLGQKLGAPPPKGTHDNRPWVLTAEDVAAIKIAARPTAGRPRKQPIPAHPRQNRRKSLPTK